MPNPFVYPLLDREINSLLQSELEALKAYDKYIEDAQSSDSQPCVELFRKLQQEEMQHAQELRQHLQEMMQKGKM